MSSNHIELERIIPEGSVMSDQFDQSNTSGATETMVGQVAPLYSTVPEAQGLHNRYHSEQVQYTQPVQPDTANEYDLIDQHKAGVGTAAPVVKYQADNVLYGDQMAAEQLRHQTLTLEKQKKYAGSTLNEPSFSRRRLCKPKSMFCCFFLSVAFLMAAGALALVIVLIVGAYPVPCSCDQAPADLTADLEELRAMVTNLSAKVDMYAPEAVGDDFLRRLMKLEGVAVARSNLSVNPHDGCVTSVEAECDIDAFTGDIPISSLCETPRRLVDTGDGSVATDIHCVYAGNNTDSNPLVGTPRFENSEVSCLCAVVVVNPVDFVPQQSTIKCGIRITRCPISVSIDTPTFIAP